MTVRKIVNHGKVVQLQSNFRMPPGSLVRRTAIGPGNTLYSEGDTVATVTTQSWFSPLEQVCYNTPDPLLVKSAVLEADLDDHFTAPFSLR